VVWVLHGAKRSGNHALVNWLLPQLRGAFVNNAIPLGPILRGRAIPAPVRFEEWWRKRQGAATTGHGSLLVSMEDHELSVLPFMEEGIDMRRILVVRQPRQLFSSRLRKASRVDMPAYPRSNDATMQRAVAIWKQHARCYLGIETQHYPRRVAISFDAWFSDRSYRAVISEAMTLPFDDSGFGRVASDGGGSSFDGTDFDGRNREMNVLDRVSQLEAGERAVLEEIFRDTEMQRLAAEIEQSDPYALLRVD
jgi:hypothetical protein